MSEYTNYLRRQLGIKEGQQLKPAGISRDEVDPQELEKGIKVEMEHTNDRAMAERIALQHLAEDEKYYSRMEKCHLKEFSPFGSLVSPTAKSPTVLAIGVRGTPGGNMPTSLAPSDTAIAPEGAGVDPTDRAALGGFEPVTRQNPNSTVVDKTPQNTTINSSGPIADVVPPTPADEHPAQIQQVDGEPAQALVGSTDDAEAPMGDKPEPEKFEVSDEDDISLKSAVPDGMDINVPDDETGEEEKKTDEEGEELPSNMVKDDDEEIQDKLTETFRRHLKLMNENTRIGDGAPTPMKFVMDKEKAGFVKVEENSEEEVSETYSPAFEKMRGLAGLSDSRVLASNGLWEQRTNECKPCGCKKPNTVHVDKTSKFTTEQLETIQEKLMKKANVSPLNEQELAVSKKIQEVLQRRKTK